MSGRRARARRGDSVAGLRVEAEIGAIAHGGHCVARIPVGTDGEGSGTRVVFVRHAVPGERAVIEITEGGPDDRFWRGDAVEIVRAAPDRVPPPCPDSGPARCGGCDFQHVSLPRQRLLKAEVVREQLRRLAGIEHPVTVEPVEGDSEGLRWRTRMRYAVTADGSRGLRAHRSAEVIQVADCLLAHPDAEARQVQRVATVDAAGWGSHRFAAPAEEFWQVHPGAPAVLVETVLRMLAPQLGERALDLYAGVGLFARFLADAVGADGRVDLVEGDSAACRSARRHLDSAPARTSVICGPVSTVLGSGSETRLASGYDVVVLDPPRAGAKRRVVEQIIARSPRAIAYVACDPAALARDLRTFGESGYGLAELRALDLFPMTHHVECVALLEKAS
ncbi:MAG: class I SAM-dependent RNA methyltransferase [Nocardioides sp.]